MHSSVATLTIGSRGSQLALWQAHYIEARLRGFGIETQIKIIKTTGDHLQTASLVQAGGKGLFTKEIEEALLAKEIDVAVHSLKDLPTTEHDTLSISAIPEREDARDALLGRPLNELASGARVGTSSLRRVAQLRLLRPDLVIEPVRGNVDTRLRKLQEGQYDAIVLAVAGLKRLNLDRHIAQVFTPDEICPAAGQGALAIQTRRNDPAAEICAELNHGPTSLAVACERAALTTLGGGCQLPVGVFAEATGDDIHVRGIVISPDASCHIAGHRTGSKDHPLELGRSLAAHLLARGAHAILSEI